MSFFKKFAHSIGSVAKVAVAPIKITTSAVGSVASHIPVVGKPLGAAVNIANGPLNVATSIASGARVDHAIVNNVKDQVKSAKTLAPYATMVLHQIPLVGHGADAAIAAGTALVNGKRIDKVLVEGVKGALPAEMHSTFDQAFNMARTAVSDNRQALDTVLKNLPADKQKVFQAAQSLGHAARLQTAVAKSVASPGTTLQIKALAAPKIKADPVLSAGKLVLAWDKEAEHGYEVAIGTFSHDTSPTAVDALRKAQTPKALLGFNIGMAVHVGQSLHPAPAKMAPREKFGYYAVYGMQTATNAQKQAMLALVAHDNSARVGVNAAVKEIKTGWWPKVVNFVHTHLGHKKAS